jgi:catechol 2,3-dioxygenase-like lactoylglutathione lyase family enzyme
MTDLSGLGVPALDWGEVFHLGIRVADLEAAQRELTESIGVRWTTPAAIPMKAWAPDTGFQSYDLTISFTTDGPVHIELLHGSPGGYHDVSQGGAGLHHIGVWVDDVAKVNQELVGQGYTVELAGDTPEKGYGSFTYVRSPGGVLFEPESGLHGSKERFERWYAGGNLF